MSSVNKVILIGRCGRDPEVRTMPSGQAVANVSVATSSRSKDKATGEYQDVTEWHNITFFDKLAEIAQKFLTKGANVYIEGKIKTSKYTGKDGIERVKVDIIANEMQLLSAKAIHVTNDIDKQVDAILAKQAAQQDDDIPF